MQREQIPLTRQLFWNALLDDEVLLIFNQRRQGSVALEICQDWVWVQEVALEELDHDYVSVFSLGDQDRVAEIELDLQPIWLELRQI